MKRIAATLLMLVGTAGLSRGEMITYTIGPIGDVSWNGGTAGVQGELNLVGINGNPQPNLGYTASFVTGDLTSSPLEFAAGGQLVIRNSQGTGLIVGSFVDGAEIVDQGGGLFRLTASGLIGNITTGGLIYGGNLTLVFADTDPSDGFSVSSIQSGSILLELSPTGSGPSVPEPASLAMASLGLIVVGIAARRHN